MAGGAAGRGQLSDLAARLLSQAGVSLPLFLLVAVGYAAMRLLRWPADVPSAVSRVVFTIAIPALLFRLMASRADLPPADPRLLVAFFGGCLVVFVIGRLIAAVAFRMDGEAQSVFALGGVFSNNVMLGLPLAQTALGPQALPAVAFVLVFNALVLWTLVTVSVEWARHGGRRRAGVAATARGVLANPIILAVLGGTAFSFTGLHLPAVVDAPLGLLAGAATPMALVALGMSLVQYGVRAGWRTSLAITVVKLAVMPVVVWALALALGLGVLETQVVVLLAATATGVNVYLMAQQFAVLEGPVAGALVLSTALAAVTTPVALALVGA